MPVSIREVAAEAGVSLATVSRVLNSQSSARIAPLTRARVEQVASQLGYHPSAVARALVRRQTDTLGVVLPPTDESPLRHPFFSALLDGVLQAATTHRRDVMVFTAHPAWEGGASLAKLRDGRCDGLILFYQPPGSIIISALLDAAAPCVLVGDWREDPRLPCVDVENFESSRRITRYLIELGHERIALLSAPIQLYYVSPRIAGYRQALGEHGMAVSDARIVTELASWEPASIVQGVEMLMALPTNERPTALCCTGDDIAALALAALGQLGVRVPEEVSVTGFNDDSSAIRQHPPLTTMRQPYEDIGDRAIALMLAQIENASAPVQKLRLPAELVTRGSTAPPPHE